MMTWAVPSNESICLAKCGLLHVYDVSVHCCLVFAWAIQETIAFVPVANAMASVHRDRLVLVSITQ